VKCRLEYEQDVDCIAVNVHHPGVLPSDQERVDWKSGRISRPGCDRQYGRRSFDRRLDQKVRKTPHRDNPFSSLAGLELIKLLPSLRVLARHWLSLCYWSSGVGTLVYGGRC